MCFVGLPNARSVPFFAVFLFGRVVKFRLHGLPENQIIGMEPESLVRTPSSSNPHTPNPSLMEITRSWSGGLSEYPHNL